MTPTLVSIVGAFVGGRVFPEEAPPRTPAPFVVYRIHGGFEINFLDGAAPDKENTVVEIQAWAASPAEAEAISKSIRAALIASSAFLARPVAGRYSDRDTELNLYGMNQDFSIWSATS